MASVGKCGLGPRGWFWWLGGWREREREKGREKIEKGWMERGKEGEKTEKGWMERGEKRWEAEGKKILRQRDGEKTETEKKKLRWRKN